MTTVCVLGNVFSRNFCHWHEEMMKVIVLERFGYECNYVIAGVAPIRERTARADRYSAGANPGGPATDLFSDRTLHHSRELSQRCGVSGSAACAAREAAFNRSRWKAGVRPTFVVDRGKQTRLGRKLINEEEVCQLLHRYSFERVDMGSLSVLSQIAISRNTRVISGLHGAQFVHSQLMNPRSWVIECFSPMFLNPTYTEIYRVLHHSYAQITSRILRYSRIRTEPTCWSIVSSLILQCVRPRRFYSGT